MKRLAFLFAIAFVASGCSPIAVNTVDHHLFNEEAMLSSQPEYRIGIGDELQIKFAYNSELNEEHIPVRPDGRISVPLAKQIKAAGLTTQSSSKDILSQKYAAELKRPEVTVIVRGFNAQRVFVDGEINRPGLIPLMGP